MTRETETLPFPAPGHTPGTEPPEPYAQLLPGECIQLGDLQRNLTQKSWTFVEPVRVGSPVPDHGMAVARLKYPDGYRPLEDHEEVRADDIIWRTSCPQWEAPGPFWIGTEAYAVIMQESSDGGSTYLGRLVAPVVVDHETLAIPVRHRALMPGEALRRGDRQVHQGQTTWQQVDEELRGEFVEEPQEHNGKIRYCRPIHPQSQIWFVDLREGYGDPEGFGGIGDPFDSLETAQEKIEAASDKLGRDPFGVILDVRGIPLFAYDIPEPLPRRNQVQQAGPPLEVPEGYQLLKIGEMIRARDIVEFQGQWTDPGVVIGSRVVSGKRVARKQTGIKKPKPPKQKQAAGTAERLDEVEQLLLSAMLILRQLRNES